MKHCLFLIMLSVLVALGIWQIARWNAKVQFQNAVMDEFAVAKNVTTLDQALNSKYMEVIISGKFINSKSFYSYRLKNNKTGYDVITPFQMENGEIVLVSRGWVSDNKEDLNILSHYLSNSSTITVSGRIIDFAKNLVPLQNNFKNKIWFHLNIKDLNSQLNIITKPIYINLDTKKFLLGERRKISANAMQNKHMGYAITWFLLAISLITIYIVSHGRVQ